MSDNLRSLSEIEILALTIFGESRGEPIEGQVAVGSVIRNRHRIAERKTYHDICLAPLQFSCWNNSDPNRAVLVELASKLNIGQPISDLYFRQCWWVASGIFNWDIRDNTKGAVNYMTKRLFNSEKRPTWANNPKDLMEYGRQVFFTA